MATCLVLVIVAMICAEASAQSGCTSVLISLSPCLNYITGNSSNPSQQCCSQLANVVRSSPQCLCEVLNSDGPSLGITINQTQALDLPGSCNVQTPPISSCNAASPAPAGSPVGSPESGSIIPRGGGSKLHHPQRKMAHQMEAPPNCHSLGSSSFCWPHHIVQYSHHTESSPVCPTCHDTSC